MAEVTFTYTYFGEKIVLVCDENHELKAKYNLTQIGVSSYEELKAMHEATPIDQKDAFLETDIVLGKVVPGIVGRHPAVMPQKLNPKYIRFKKKH